MTETQYWTGGNTIKNKSSVNSSNNLVKSKKIKKVGKVGIVLIGIILVLALIVFVLIVRPALSLASNINSLQNHSQDLQAAMASRDLISFNESLDATQKDLEKLKIDKDKKFKWAANFGPTEAYYADSEHFINAGLHAVQAGREFTVVVEPFADALGFRISEDQVVEELSLAEAFSSWVGAMPFVAEDSDKIISELSKVGQELSYVEPARYPESFRGFPVRATISQAQNTLTQLNDYAPDIKEALNIIPGLLGVGTGEKRYMILFQNDKEMRATGGFWTYFATFRIENALLSSDFTSYNSYYLDDVLQPIDPIITFPTVPAAYNNHLKVERMFARDANVSPDLPTSIDQFMYFWDLAQPLSPAEFKDVDGIIVINTIVLEELMQITGPATVNGITYTEENVVLELERLASLTLREQVNRKKVLGDLMEAMLINVFESEANLWPTLVDKGFDLVKRKHVAGLVFDEQAQLLVEKHNLSGRIVDPIEGDYVFVVQTNLGGDKTNWFVNKDVTHELSKEGNRWVRTVTVKYDYPEPGAEYGPFIKRFRDWVRVYTPLGSELISVTGSEDVTGKGEERNKTYFHGFVTMGPGESKEIVFKYYLPSGVITNEEEYNLYIQKQISIDSEMHHVVVNGQTEDIELKWDKEYTTSLK